MSFFAPEQLIVERLEARVAEAVAAGTWGDRKVPKVLTAGDAAMIEERSQLAPALYVVLDGYAPVQEVARGSVQQVEQQWVVYATVRNAARAATGQGVRDDAAIMVDLVLKALCGWKPHADFGPLFMGSDKGPEYTDAGYGYFPIRFTTRCVVRGA